MLNSYFETDDIFSAFSKIRTPESNKIIGDTK